MKTHRMLNLSDDLKKTKTRLLVLSGISLFIALTEKLPQQIAIIGLDLSENETVAGWFIFAITAYFLLVFFINSIIELSKYYIPTLLAHKTKNTTGDMIGLTKDEYYAENYRDYSNIETTDGDGELESIESKNQKIIYKYKSGFVRFSNTVNLTSIAFSIIFGVISIFYLYCFLI